MSDEEKKTDVEELKDSISKLADTVKEQSDLLAALAKPEADEKKEEKKEEKKDAPPARRIDFSMPETRDVKSIGDIMTMPGYMLTDAEKAIREKADDAYITATLLKTDVRNLKMWQGFKESNTALRRAMDTATSTEGSEWVPSVLSTNLIEKYRLQARVAGLFTEISMPRNPYTLPTNLGDLTFYLIPESTSDEPSKTPSTALTTGDKTLTAKKLRGRMLWSEELDEESIVPILPAVKNNIAKSAALAVEDVIINGDTTATHQDSDVTDSKDHRKAWKGLRKHALANSYNIDLSTFDKDTTRSLLTKMGKYGIVPSDVAWITGVVGYNKMRGLAELLTVEKYGPGATILTGEVGKLYGSPVIVSEKTREDLDATGVYSGAYTELTTVNRGAFIIGNRGNWRMTVDFDNDVDQYVLNVRFKKIFEWIYDPSTEPIVAIGYKIS